MLQEWWFISVKTEGVWVVHSPTTPGAYGVGKTLDEAREDYGDAFESCLDFATEGLIRSGLIAEMILGRES